MSDQQKELQFYSAVVNAWFSTRAELDRSLLTLSAGGIGLLITLLSTVGISCVVEVILYVVALLSFLVCLGSVLFIFARNANHLQEIIHSASTTDEVLGMLDKAAAVSFLIAVVLSCAIGVATAVQSFHSREVDMSKDQNSHGLAQDSFNGATSMRPTQTDLTKSFNGAAALQPSSTSTSTTGPQAAVPANPQGAAATPGSVPQQTDSKK